MISVWLWLRRPLIAAVADVALRGASSDSHGSLDLYI